MLKGFAMAGERQCVEVSYIGNPETPSAVCAMGALQLGRYGNANHIFESTCNVSTAFYNATGIFITTANDEGMSIPDIAGILASEGY